MARRIGRYMHHGSSLEYFTRPPSAELLCPVCSVSSCHPVACGRNFTLLATAPFSSYLAARRKQDAMLQVHDLLQENLNTIESLRPLQQVHTDSFADAFAPADRGVFQYTGSTGVANTPQFRQQLLASAHQDGTHERGHSTLLTLEGVIEEREDEDGSMMSMKTDQDTFMRDMPSVGSDMSVVSNGQPRAMLDVPSLALSAPGSPGGQLRGSSSGTGQPWATVSGLSTSQSAHPLVVDSSSSMGGYRAHGVDGVDEQTEMQVAANAAIAAIAEATHAIDTVLRVTSNMHAASTAASFRERIAQMQRVKRLRGQNRGATWGGRFTARTKGDDYWADWTEVHDFFTEFQGYRALDPELTATAAYTLAERAKRLFQATGVPVSALSLVRACAAGAKRKGFCGDPEPFLLLPKENRSAPSAWMRLPPAEATDGIASPRNAAKVLGGGEVPYAVRNEIGRDLAMQVTNGLDIGLDDVVCSGFGGMLGNADLDLVVDDILDVYGANDGSIAVGFSDSSEDSFDEYGDDEEDVMSASVLSSHRSGRSGHGQLLSARRSQRSMGGLSVEDVILQPGAVPHDSPAGGDLQVTTTHQDPHGGAGGAPSRSGRHDLIPANQWPSESPSNQSRAYRPVTRAQPGLLGRRVYTSQTFREANEKFESAPLGAQPKKLDVSLTKTLNSSEFGDTDLAVFMLRLGFMSEGIKAHKQRALEDDAVLVKPKKRIEEDDYEIEDEARFQAFVHHKVHPKCKFMKSCPGFMADNWTVRSTDRKCPRHTHAHNARRGTGVGG